jgi:hypothetical protein
MPRKPRHLLNGGYYHLIASRNNKELNGYTQKIGDALAVAQAASVGTPYCLETHAGKGRVEYTTRIIILGHSTIKEAKAILGLENLKQRSY